MVSLSPISAQIWDMKYRLKAADGAPMDRTIGDTWQRVANSLASVEQTPAEWQARFADALEDFRFIPAGRILAGAGAERKVTLFNCFVMGRVPDDMSGIFEHLKEAALTMQQGGGIGYDFSTLRPKGAAVRGVGADASGPLTFMDVWDSMCRTIMSAGFRRGAMMGCLRCDHPDIEAFIKAKQDAGRLRMFNLSVLITDDFMAAVKADRPWELSFDGAVFKTVDARALWDTIMRSTFAFAEPGVIFIDRINRANNLSYCEDIFATNPCGEQPLPPYGACLLGSINLTQLVDSPFEAEATISNGALEALVETAVRMLDNAIDVSQFPLEAQRQEAAAKRRIGLGVTGLADALIMCGVRYGSPESIALTDSWMRSIERAAYLASAHLAKEKGAFPLFDAEPYLKSGAAARLDDDVREAIAAHGMRNALLTSIAPTGTISLLAGNVSSGVEPVFSFSYTRHVLMPDGTRKPEAVHDYAHRLFRELKGDAAQLPDSFVDAQQLGPEDHLVMQACVQRHIDSAVSKTVNCPEEISFEDFKTIYLRAFELGCKGCTTYRPNPVTGSVLETTNELDAPHQAEPDQATDPSTSPSADHPHLRLAATASQGELPLPSPQNRPEDAFEAGGIAYMTQPLERPEALHGNTYKIRWPENDHAIYITINDTICDSRRRPFEVFINSKNMDHYAWTVGLTRMISAVFRRGGDITFVVDELKAVFDPRGGQWMGGRYIPSLLAAIGSVIEQHLIAIGFMPHSEGRQIADAARAANGEATDKTPRLPEGSCPRCSQPSLLHQEGCDICATCGYSKCA